MDTAAVHSAPSPAPRQRRVIVGTTIVVMVVAAAAIAVAWRMMANRPPAPNAEPVVVAKFAATPEFARLPIEQRAPYIQTLRASVPELVAATRAGKFTKEEQIQLTRNAIQAGARIELAHYFSLKTAPERVALLDKLIKEQEQLKQHAANYAANGGQPPIISLMEMKQFIETLPPDERVQMAELAFDMFKRRAQQGLPLWPWGGNP